MRSVQHVRNSFQAGALDIMGLRIDTILYTEYLPTYVDNEHSHETWQLFYFLNGTGIISINGVEETVSGGHVAIVRPFDQHFFRNHGDRVTLSLEIKWHFSHTLDEFLTSPKWSGIFRDRYGLRTYVNQAIQELMSRRRNWEPMLRAVILSMLVQVDRALLAEVKRIGENETIDATYGYRHTMVQKAINYVVDHLHEALSVKDVAAFLCISPGYLSELFKKETGQSFTPWVIDQKMALARKALLADPDRPVEDIAQSIGYYDARYFSRLFKVKTGVSPTQFRTTNVNRDAMQRNDRLT
ncbi:MAG TPA: AraC family transcriptional regulator [Firmicutes bacterium]|jgi:AraC-like DNA-binding protein/mannose-6-phosphate isomerase-like protein (cupin superfamily)|nr:AraC family transcriptional regulator [Bacillota bacterium]